MDTKSAVALSIIKTLGLLSLPMARRFGACIGWLVQVTNSRMYRVTRKNIELCFPNMASSEQKQLAVKSLVETSKTMAETGIAWGGSDEKFKRNADLIKSVRNEQLFHDAVGKGNGVLFLTPHIGNWEILTSWLPQRITFSALYKIAKMPGFEATMLKTRESSGVKMLSGTREGVKTFFNNYKNQEHCLILPDQEPSLKSGVWAPFFGVNCLTPKSVQSMIKRNPDGVVLMVYAIRVEKGFEVVFREVESGIYSDDEIEYATAMNKSIEHCIADAPEQYQWEYKRFKKNPEGYYKGM